MEENSINSTSCTVIDSMSVINKATIQLFGVIPLNAFTPNETSLMPVASGGFRIAREGMIYHQKLLEAQRAEVRDPMVRQQGMRSLGRRQ